MVRVKGRSEDTEVRSRRIHGIEGITKTMINDVEDEMEGEMMDR